MNNVYDDFENVIYDADVLPTDTAWWEKNRWRFRTGTKWRWDRDLCSAVSEHGIPEQMQMASVHRKFKEFGMEFPKKSLGGWTDSDIVGLKELFKVPVVIKHGLPSCVLMVRRLWKSVAK